ncbi:hypothetical protein QJQ45_030047, partial [Haematococcus lacustris]
MHGENCDGPSYCTLHGVTARIMSDDDKPCCFICLDAAETAESGPLGRQCQCPNLYSHKSCLIRWQLQQAGKPEETMCRFCRQNLKNWREACAPIATANPSTKKAVMAVVFQGKTVKVPVITGPDGVAEFKRTVCKLFDLPEGTDFEVTFECKSPVFGDKLHLKGFGCFEAASYCAAVSAARRGAASTSHKSHHRKDSHGKDKESSISTSSSALATSNGPPTPPQATPGHPRVSQRRPSCHPLLQAPTATTSLPGSSPASCSTATQASSPRDSPSDSLAGREPGDDPGSPGGVAGSRATTASLRTRASSHMQAADALLAARCQPSPVRSPGRSLGQAGLRDLGPVPAAAFQPLPRMPRGCLARTSASAVHGSSGGAAAEQNGPTAGRPFGDEGGGAATSLTRANSDSHKQGGDRDSRSGFTASLMRLIRK